MKKYVKIVENIGLMATTGLAAGVLMVVIGTFGLSDVPGIFQLAAGTLSVAWITMFLLANWKEEGEVKDVHNR